MMLPSSSVSHHLGRPAASRPGRPRGRFRAWTRRLRLEGRQPPRGRERCRKPQI